MKIHQDKDIASVTANSDLAKSFDLVEKDGKWYLDSSYCHAWRDEAFTKGTADLETLDKHISDGQINKKNFDRAVLGEGRQGKEEQEATSSALAGSESGGDSQGEECLLVHSGNSRGKPPTCTADGAVVASRLPHSLCLCAFVVSLPTARSYRFASVRAGRGRGSRGYPSARCRAGWSGGPAGPAASCPPLRTR